MHLRKRYVSLDIAKFICAWLIIILHTAPLASYSKMLSFGIRMIITVVAVPFFFASSGFLFFSKYNALTGVERKKYLLDYVKRIAIMYLIWALQEMLVS